jgi:hypothetical protein
MTERERQDAETLFEQLVARLSADPAVTPPSGGTGFGASGLKADGKLFAMLVKGELVVKLPKQRVDQLIAEGTGTRFDPGHGRLMKEWVGIASAHGSDWDRLAAEAREYVTGGAARPRRS